jgi:DNA gyrase subunit A
LPVLSRTAQGAIAMRLRKQDKLVGCAVLGTEDGFLLVSEAGCVKRMLIKSFRRSAPGELGTQVSVTNNKADAIAQMVPAFPDTEVAVVTSAHRIANLEINAVAIAHKEDRGTNLFQLNDGEKIITVTDPLVAWSEDV